MEGRGGAAERSLSWFVWFSVLFRLVRRFCLGL